MACHGQLRVVSGSNQSSKTHSAHIAKAKRQYSSECQQWSQILTLTEFGGWQRTGFWELSTGLLPTHGPTAEFVMTPEQPAYIAGTWVVACHFLQWIGLLFAPKTCPVGHSWRPQKHNQKEVEEDDLEEPTIIPRVQLGLQFTTCQPQWGWQVGRPWDLKKLAAKEKQCLEKKTWMALCPMAQFFPRSVM